MPDLKPFLQTLRERLSISDVVGSHVKLTRKGNDYKGLCPFHKEKTPSFKVNDERGSYYCFGCSAHGDIFDFTMQKLNMPFMEAVTYLAGILGLDVPKGDGSPARSSTPKADPTLYEVLEAACAWFEQQLALTHGAPARAYLEQRQLLPETIAGFRLGYAPYRGLEAALLSRGFSQKLVKEAGLTGVSERNNETYDRFRDRLMFPIWDTRGRVIAFGGRILKEGDPKYLNSADIPTFSKGKTLYAYHKAVPAARQGGRMIVAEGYMDVIALHQAGFKTSVAPLGTALTLDQISLLWRIAPDPVLCFDGDEAGTRAAHRAAHLVTEIVKGGKTLEFCFLPGGHDPDSLLLSGKKDELSQMLTHPQPLMDVLWSVFCQGRKLSTPEQKDHAQKELKDLVAEFKDPGVRHFYAQEFKERLYTLLNPRKTFNPTQFTKQTGANTGVSARLSTGSSQAVPSFPLISRIVPDKNQMVRKILLATLLNHPTLIEEIEESLVSVGEWMGEYERLCQAILLILNENSGLHAPELQKQLQVKGFGQALAGILTPQIYYQAPFCRITATMEEALKGWKDIWHGTVDKFQIAKETSRIATEAQEKLTPQNWEKLQVLRIQTISKEDEKKGV